MRALVHISRDLIEKREWPGPEAGAITLDDVTIIGGVLTGTQDDKTTIIFGVGGWLCAKEQG